MCDILTQFYSQSSWFSGVSFGSSGSDSASCPYRRSPLLFYRSSTSCRCRIRMGEYAPPDLISGDIRWGGESHTGKAIPPGSVGLAQAHPLTNPPAIEKAAFIQTNLVQLERPTQRVGALVFRVVHSVHHVDYDRFGQLLVSMVGHVCRLLNVRKMTGHMLGKR